jgi:hypothetical protein
MGIQSSFKEPSDSRVNCITMSWFEINTLRSLVDSKLYERNGKSVGPPLMVKQRC